jgi:hydroxyethylthiazole kinase-like uncharacterized protein yjeF
VRGVSAEKMAEIDEAARTEFGISQLDLMEQAGTAVAEAVKRDVPLGTQADILVVCGKGNNGGDGFVAARHLFEYFGKNLRFCAPDAGDIREGAARENFNRLISLGLPSMDLFSVLSAITERSRDLIVVDALLGTGFRGSMTGLYGDIAEQACCSGARVYSADIPSGLDATTGKVRGKCFRAFKTITFGLTKSGFYTEMGPEVCGDIEVADIGFPKDLLERFL